MSTRDAVTVAGFRLGWSLVRHLPARTAYQLFDGLAEIAYRRNTKDVRRLRANYARVAAAVSAAELEQLVRDGMRSYLRYWCDAFRLQDRSADDLAAQVIVRGDEPVRAALAQGRGAVCFLGHMGNWDLAGAWSTTHLAPVTTVAERLKPEAVYAEFLAFREQLGMTILPLTGGDPTFPQLVRAVREGALVPLLADRDLTQSGMPVTFFGQEARMAAGPAALAVATGAPLFPVSVHYAPPGPGATLPASASGGHALVITFHPEVPVPSSGTTRAKAEVMTQACADALAGAIARHLPDWHMMQRVFAADLDPNRE